MQISTHARLPRPVTCPPPPPPPATPPSLACRPRAILSPGFGIATAGPALSLPGRGEPVAVVIVIMVRLAPRPQRGKRVRQGTNQRVVQVHFSDCLASHSGPPSPVHRRPCLSSLETQPTDVLKGPRLPALAARLSYALLRRVLQPFVIVAPVPAPSQQQGSQPGTYTLPTFVVSTAL